LHATTVSAHLKKTSVLAVQFSQTIIVEQTPLVPNTLTNATVQNPEMSLVGK
ncbi:hypothetical protein ABEB36_003257, partial [Hypothenemus hampei]